MIEKTISEVGKFTFGKHKGKRFTDVLREDYGYLLYLDGKGFSFTNNARVMMHITQYVHKKTKNYTSGNFMYHMLVATYFAVDYAKREHLDSEGWNKLKGAIEKLFEDPSERFEHDIPQHLAQYVIESESGELVLGLAFLAMTENKAPIDIIPRIMEASDPEAIYEALSRTMEQGAKKTAVRETSIKQYINWGIW